MTGGEPISESQTSHRIPPWWEGLGALWSLFFKSTNPFHEVVRVWCYVRCPFSSPVILCAITGHFLCPALRLVCLHFTPGVDGAARFKQVQADPAPHPLFCLLFHFLPLGLAVL